jgi:hypothetical protein
MDLFAIDDSKQRKPTRDGMGPLVAVGGLHVPGDKVRQLELELDALCGQFGFPPGAEFKWSPDKKMWEHANLQLERREAFHLQALSRAEQAGAKAIVVMEDTKKNRAINDAASPEEDVTRMFLERAQRSLAPGQYAIAVFDRPGGDRKAETSFLAATLSTLREGTTYSTLDRLALAVSTDSRLSRLVQLADVVTGCTTSYVAGEDTHSPKIFKEGVFPLLREDYGCKGGRGVKIHPDQRYGNLYHWLLGDGLFVRHQGGLELPSNHFTCYRESPDVA